QMVPEVMLPRLPVEKLADSRPWRLGHPGGSRHRALGHLQLGGQCGEPGGELRDGLTLYIARQLHDLLVQLPDRDLSLAIADLEVVDRHLAGDPRDPLLLGGEQARQAVRGALADQDDARLADGPVDYVHVPVSGDRGRRGEAATQAL